jgi:type IV pilus assembly protein PilQ
MRTRSFQFALILLASAALLRSQPAPAVPAASAPEVKAAEPAAPAASAPAVKAAEPAVTVQGTEPATTGVSRTKDTLSVDFPDEDIRTILRNVADLFELNLVIPETMQGKTSIKLRDVTWRQIFEVVLTPIGYTYIEQGTIIKIVSLESLAAEPVNTEIFVFNYARASEIMPIVSSLVESAAGGKIVIDARSNSLVITERPSRLNRIRPIITQLDKATDQVMIESKFIEVTDRDVKNIGANWSSLSGTTLGLGPLSQTIKGDSIPETLKNLVLHNSDSRNSTPVSAVFSATDFKLILSALQTLNNTKIVSNPTIVTLNNQEASINVGEEDPIPNYTYNQEHGSFEVSGFLYKPIGIILKVTPQVNARGFIKLILAPEVSQKSGTVTFGGAGGAEIPIIATRKASTQVTLKDGYTMGIGGLLTSNGVKGNSKVPILGSIPVLGRLFRSNSRDVTTTNLLIFVTAKTISSEGAPIEQVFNSKQLRDMSLRREDLPGYRDGSDPFLPPEQPSEQK